MNLVLCFLALVVGFDGQTETAKVMVFEVFVAGLLVYRIWKNQLKWQKTDWLYVVILGLATLGNNWIGSPFRLQGGILTVFLLVWAKLAEKAKKEIPELWAGLGLVGLVIMTAIFGFNEAGRAVGPMGEPNALAAAGLFLWPWLKGKKRWAGVVLASWLIWMTKSESGLVGLVVELMVLNKFFRVGLVVFILSLGLPFLKKPVIFEDRTEVWKTAVQAGLMRPVLGWGMGKVEIGIQAAALKLQNNIRWQSVDSAHNLFLDWWVQGGIVGVGLMGIAVYRMFKDKKTRTVAMGVLVVMSFNPASVVTLAAFWWLVGRGSFDHDAKVVD